MLLSNNLLSNIKDFLFQYCHTALNTKYLKYTKNYTSQVQVIFKSWSSFSSKYSPLSLTHTLTVILTFLFKYHIPK